VSTQRRGPPEQINCQIGLDFITWRQDPQTRGVYGCGRNTAILDLKIMSTFLQEAIKRGFITVNPTRGLGLIKDKPREKAEISTVEESRIRQALPNWPEWMGVAFEIAIGLASDPVNPGSICGISMNHGKLSHSPERPPPHFGSHCWRHSPIKAHRSAWTRRIGLPRNGGKIDHVLPPPSSLWLLALAQWHSGSASSGQPGSARCCRQVKS